APRTVRSSPSCTSSKMSAPSTSMRRIPPRTSASGPGLGKRPDCDSATLTTTRTPDSSSASADTRSRSVWSMIAMSSAERRLTRFFVRRSSLAWPVSSTKLIGRSLAHAREELAAAEHALQLVAALCFVERLDARMRRVARNLFDAEVTLGDTRDLRKVGDRDDLRSFGKSLERLGHAVCGLTADARVDLVEHHRVAAGNRCDRERDSRQLASRGGLRNRCEG